jgi:peroxiredoxin
MSELIGQAAPDFSLNSHLGETVQLSSYQNQKNVVLVFYPLDFSPICSMQLPEFSGSSDDFDAMDTVVLGINRDSVHCHRAWAADYGIEVPLLSDMKLEVAKAYGVALEERAISKRATFLIDKKGIIREAFTENATGEYTFHPKDVLEKIRAL